MANVRALEAKLWESADLLRAESKMTSNQYCMPVLGLIFLRYAYSRFKRIEAELMKNRPSRGGRVMPITAIDFVSKSAIFLPREAQYEYLVNLPDGENIGEAVNTAMELIEKQSPQLSGVLPKDYTSFPENILRELLRYFNDDAIDEVGGDVIGRIYEYFLNKFAKNIASDDGVFFTPKSLVKMIVNIIEPHKGILLDPACGSGGMFVQSGDFVSADGTTDANKTMTFYGQEKVEYNSQLCLMNLAVHGLSGKIASGSEANSFYHDVYNLEGKCDYVMANPPFNVDKVKSEDAASAGRLPFGLPGVNAKTKEIGNGNYLWISYFYSYLNEKGRAGFVMASSATDSQNKDAEIRKNLVKTGHVDVMISVGNNFFYTKSLPCSLWFFDKGKPEELQNKVLLIDARNYYTVVDRTLNEWTEWQLKNIHAIVNLYRGKVENYKQLLKEYKLAIDGYKSSQTNKVILDSLSVSGKFADRLSAMKVALKTLQADSKKEIEKAAEDKTKDGRQKKKDLEIYWTTTIAEFESMIQTVTEADWLYSKFGEGVYADVEGLCKIATLEEIEEKNWSLTPGAYVGVAAVEDDGVDFTQRMKEIHTELLSLQEESNNLMNTISQNLKELGL